MQRIIPWLVVLLALPAAWSQEAVPHPSPPLDPLVGTWRTTIPYDAGAPIEGVLQVFRDGRYREEMVFRGQIAAYWEGTIALAPDGTVTQRETGRSPRICILGRCQPNEGPTTTVSRLAGRTPHDFTLAYRDPATGQDLRIVWRRAAGAVPPQPPLPAPEASPLPPTPAAPRTPPAPRNPLGDETGGRPAGATPWTGTYTDGDVTVRFAGSGGDHLERDGARYPLRLQGDDRRLEGTFVGGGTPFPVTIERAGDGIVLESAGARYELAPAGSPEPGPSANPLGD